MQPKWICILVSKVLTDPTDEAPSCVARLLPPAPEAQVQVFIVDTYPITMPAIIQFYPFLYSYCFTMLYIPYFPYFLFPPTCTVHSFFA